MADVFASIGSNVDRARNLGFALLRLRKLYGDLNISGVYESEPVGFDGSPFYNVVVGFNSEQTPAALVAAFRKLESERGRARDGAKFGPRTLDVDLLLYDDLVTECDGFRLPRKEITRFAFVLGPLAEIAAHRRHPLEGKTFAELWADFSNPVQRIRRLPQSADDLMHAIERESGAAEARAARSGS